MAKIEVAPGIEIDERELEESFVLASGPGGQNVNKVATAVELRFDMLRSSLPREVMARLMLLAGTRMTKDGVLVLVGRQYRTQDRNRSDVRERLLSLVREAAVAPAKRKKTRPPRAAKEERLKGKKQRSEIKRGRKARIEY
jgi:ribosome-associated protein